MNLFLDEENHVYHKGHMDYETKSFSNGVFVPPEQWESFMDDCKTVFNCTAIEDCEFSDYSSGHTYFQLACNNPRCTLEALALSIFRFHTQGVIFNPSLSGAEWWVQHINSLDDIGVHWDRDYGLEDEHGIHIHPHLGTVTYLSNCGGPTLIFNKRGSLTNQESICGGFTSYVVSSPKIGKHICFDGTLLHAAPGDFTDSIDHGMRTTFLVNIWLNHIPSQTTCVSGQMLSRLSKYNNIELRADYYTVPNTVYLSATTSIPKVWSFCNSDQNYVLRIIAPTQLHGQSLFKSFELIEITDVCNSTTEMYVTNGELRSTSSSTTSDTDESNSDGDDCVGDD